MDNSSTIYRLRHALVAGWVDDWLVLGPLAVPVLENNHNQSSRQTEVPSKQIQAIIPFEGRPTQLDKIRWDGHDVFWKLDHAPADHCVERSLLTSTWQQTSVWAFCVLESKTPGPIEAELVATCPCGLWVNGQPVALESAPWNVGEPGCPRTYHARAHLPLQAGDNDLYLCLEDEGRGERLLSARLRLADERADDLCVITPVLSPELDYWKTVEDAYAQSRLDKPVYSGTDRITLLGPEKQDRLMRANVRLQQPNGKIYGEFTVPLLCGEPMPIAAAIELPSGEYQAVLMPPPENYYEKQFRPTRSLPFQVRNEKIFSPAAVSSEPVQALVLEEAVRRGGVFGQVALMALGRAGLVDEDLLTQAAQKVAVAGNLLDLLGLLLLATQSEHTLSGELQAEITRAAVSFPYLPLEEQNESEQLLGLACQVLAGQMASRHRFAAFGQLGRSVRKTAGETARAWLQQHGLWGSNRFDPDPLCAALAALAEYAGDESLAELAAVSLDQLAFQLALRNAEGLGDPVGAFLPAMALKSARLAPGAGLGLWWWGEGVSGGEVAGAVALALCDSYQLPDLIRSIALDRSDSSWTVACSQPGGEMGRPQRYSIYRAAGFRLSSIHYPGAAGAGCGQHQWQATLGAEAVVFTNAPGGYSQASYHPAGFWRGSARRLEVGQWQDALVCRYGPPTEDTLAFTHAYFPIFAFDEYRQIGDWAFARKGEVYLGLYADQGLELVEAGEDAGRELRSDGRVWVCQMGHKGIDGEFADFCGRVSASAPLVSEGEVRWTTPRELSLRLDGNGEFWVNDHLQTLEPPLDSPYAQLDRPTGVMTIRSGQDGLELRFD